MTTKFDTWLAHNPVEDEPHEISNREWNDDYWDIFPMEETKCAICSCWIGAVLGIDDETSADVPRYIPIWLLPDERPACEDCAFPDEVEAADFDACVAEERQSEGGLWDCACLECTRMQWEARTDDDYTLRLGEYRRETWPEHYPTLKETS